MRILYHHRTLADGAEGIHIAEMVHAFRELGHEVQVLGLAQSGAGGGRRQWIGRLRDSVPEALFEAGAVTANVPEYLEVRRAMDRFAPDFLYKRHARHDVAALSAARRAGIPAVLEVNCLFTGDAYRGFEPMALAPVAAALERRALRLASVRLAVSTPLARQIETVSGTRAVVMPNGVDPARFDPARAQPAQVRSRYGLGDDVVVGWTGVLRDWHGLEVLLEAVAPTPRVRLLVVGDGPARPAFEARARTLGMGERLAITGRIPHDAMPDYVAAMDVAVVADDRTRVASPMKLIEYMAMARAVVAPRLDNITDVVRDGESGLLFTPGDATALATVLATLIGDAELRSRLGRRARATVETERNWRHNAETVVSLVLKAGTAR